MTEEPEICDLCGRQYDDNHAMLSDDIICLGPPTAHQYNQLQKMLDHYLGRIATELERGSGDGLSDALAGR